MTHLLPDGLKHRRSAWSTGVLVDLRRAGADSNVLLTAGIAVVALLQLHHVFVQGINWDEFFYHSHIYELRAGTMDRALQTIHARLFAWLPYVPGTEMEEIRAARLVMLACELITVAGVVAIARHFTGLTAGLIAGLAYIGGGFVFQHGFSFRADPLAAALLTSALWLMLRSRLSPVGACSIAILAALAGLVTIKSIFYAPAFVGIAVLRIFESERRAREAIRIGATGVLTLLLFAGIYLLHESGLDRASPGTSGVMLGSASEKMFSMGLVPRPGYVLKQAVFAPFLTLAVLAAPVVLAMGRRRWTETAALAGLLLPIASLLIYRNSFPYFYAFILPPVVAAAAVTLPPVIGRYGPAALAAALVVNPLALYLTMPKDMQDVQARVISAAHAIFPEPVAYFDARSMLATFPKKGFFMSGWGLENYREAGSPVMKRILETEAVPLVVANHEAFEAAFAGKAGPLLREDAAAIRANYIHHWGPLWVAGKQIPAGNALLISDVAVPGIYTLEGASIVVDGRSIDAGETVYLERGRHRLVPDRARDSWLRWGDHMPLPGHRAPQKPYFTDF